MFVYIFDVRVRVETKCISTLISNYLVLLSRTFISGNDNEIENFYHKITITRNVKPVPGIN